MGRNYLKGRDGDRINVLTAAGDIFGLFPRWLERLFAFSHPDAAHGRWRIHTT